MVIRNYLSQNFKLDDTRIKTLGLGKTKQTDGSGKIEIIVYPPGANASRVQNQSPASC